MANISQVHIKVLPKKNGEVAAAVNFHEPEWAEFVPLFCEASYGGDGYLKSEATNRFCVDGRWNYTNGLEWTVTKTYLRWLKDHGFDGVNLEYMETETGLDFINFGRLTITFEGYAAHVQVAQFSQNMHAFSEEYELEVEDLGDYFSVEAAAQEKGLALLENSLDEILEHLNCKVDLSLPLAAVAVVESEQAVKKMS